MASKIKGKTLHMQVTPYRVDGVSDEFNELSVYPEYNARGKYFYVCFHAGWCRGAFRGGMVMGFGNPLTDAITVRVKDAPKNSQKLLDQMAANLTTAARDIVWLFDERKWEWLKHLLADVALLGYTPGIEGRMRAYREEVKVKAQCAAAQEKSDREPYEKTKRRKAWRLLKAQHKGAMLLMRHDGEIWTLYEDAYDLAAIVKQEAERFGSHDTPRFRFPKEQLENYLPLIIRTGKTPVVCDRIEVKKNDNNSNQNNSEDKVMTNETMKVTDLIGKSVCNGNAKYVIKSVDGDKVKVDFAMGDNAAKEMNMKAEQIEKLLQGGWTVQGSEECRVKSEEFATAQEAPKGEELKAKTVTMEKPKQEKPKADQSKVTLKRKQPQAEPETKAGKLTYSTYTNAKGKTCAKVSGFAETDAAYQKEAAASLHGSATYENTKQGRVNFLLFGPRYAEVAKTVCQMLNEGRTVADCQAVVDRATEERAQKREERAQKREERAQKREEWKQKREAYRQEREGKAQTEKPHGKTYTEAEVADLMRRVIAGDKEAMAIVNAMAA